MFGVNTFLATILKTIITLIVSDKKGLGLDVHSQVSHTHSDYDHAQMTSCKLTSPIWEHHVF